MYEYDLKLLKIIANNTPKVILGLVLLSLTFVWTYIDYIPVQYILLWSLAQILFIISRYLNGKKLAKYIKENNSKKIKVHARFFSFIVIISSVIWSAGTLLGSAFAPTPYEFVSFTMIIGIVAGAVLTLTPVFRVFIVYISVMTITQLGIMIYFATHAHIALGILLIINLPVVVLLAKSMHTHHLVSIEGQKLLESHAKELKELSITDSLTKVYNRRHFFEAAQTLVSISKREKSEVSFLMIDIDHFKNVNDTYGHQIGDYILVRLSEEIQNMVRDSDIFARIGGEEFALLLHNTSLEGAKIIAEKIRTTIERIEFNDNYISIDITVSIGCSTLNNKLRTLEELYQEADKKLYIAKELGRNRVQ